MSQDQQAALDAAREEGRRAGAKQMRSDAAERVLRLKQNGRWHTRNEDYRAGARDAWSMAAVVIRALSLEPPATEPPQERQA